MPYCPACGEALPKWTSEEAEIEARLTFFPCGCGAAAKRDGNDEFVCTNPICKMYLKGVC